MDTTTTKSNGPKILLKQGQNDVAFMDQRPTTSTDATTEETTSKKKKKKKSAGSKLERKMKREEEKLRAMYGPKDSHVKLISASVLQKLQGALQQEQSQAKSYNALFDPNDFPSFGSPTVNSSTVKPTTLDAHFPSLNSSDLVTPNNNNKGIKTTTQVDSLLCTSPESIPEGTNHNKSMALGRINENENSPHEVQQQSEGVTETPIKSTTTTTPIILGSSTVSKKKLSKKPIVISLDDLIVKKTPMKDLAKTKVKKRVDDMAKRYSNVTVGNTLDSSGPMFIHRGKMREKPKKKKPTKLKMAIMKSRSIRMEQKISQSDETNIPSQESQNHDLTTEDTNTVVKDDLIESIKDVNESLEQCTINTPDSPEVIEEGSHAENGESQSSVNIIVEPNLIQNCGTSSLQKDNSVDTDNIFVALLNSAIKENNEESIKQNEKQGESTVVSTTKVPVISCEVISQAKQSLHSRKFKPYCDMYLSKELHGHVIALLKELHRFQDRLYHSDPIKYKTKRRFIHGIKDTINSLKINKVVLVIFAPDIESSNADGGLDEKIEEIKSVAKEKNVPVVYSGNRFVLGKPIFCKTAVSVISILDRQGAESLYFKVIEEAGRLREKYEKDLSQKIQEIMTLPSS